MCGCFVYVYTALGTVGFGNKKLVTVLGALHFSSMGAIAAADGVTLEDDMKGITLIDYCLKVL